MARLKNAPFLKDQPQNAPLDEITILAGSRAWAAYGKEGKGEEWRLMQMAHCSPLDREIDESRKPIILGEQELKQLDRLRILPEGHRTAKIYQIGELTEAQKTAICLNLAKHTTADNVGFYADSADNLRLLENASAFITKLRRGEGTDTAELIAQTTEDDSADTFADYFKTLYDSEKLGHFLKWYAKPICHDKTIQAAYVYNGKKWEMQDETDLGRAIRQFYEEKKIPYNKTRIENLIGLIKYTADPMGKRAPHLLGFNNGVLNKYNGTFKPHKKGDFLTSFIDIDYSESDQATPNFDKWLDWTSKGDEAKKQRILAALFMILTNRHDWQLFLEITGAGGTGKSVFNDLAIMLAGEDNSTSISLRELEDPSIREKLLDKTLFYSSDQESYIGDGAELRAITGGDSISINPKYKKPFDARISAVFLMTNNTPIIFKESKGGIARRRVIFHFGEVVPYEMRDSKLKQKLKAEAGGIVRTLLTTFQNANEAKRLLEEQRKSMEAVSVKAETDHILQFAQHFYTTEEARGLQVGSRQATGGEQRALYNAYLYYCDSVGNKNPLGRALFLRRIEYAFKDLGEKNAFIIRHRENTQFTNAHYKNLERSLNEWRG